MAEYNRKELEKNYHEKCKEISNFCFIEDDNKKQMQYYESLGASNFMVPSVPPPVKMNQSLYAPNYPQPMVHSRNTTIPPYNINPYGNSMNTCDHAPMNTCDQAPNQADFERIFHDNQQQSAFPVSGPLFVYGNQPINLGTQDLANILSQPRKEIKVQHIYSSGSVVFGDSLDGNSFKISPKYLSGNSDHDYSGKKIFKKSRKYPGYIPFKKEETTSTTDIDIDVSSVVLNLKRRSETKSNFLEIISQFSRLSVYAMEMCRERMSLDSIITGYTNSVTNYYLPTVISNISGHIKIIRQSLGYEFYEIWKLIDSIEMINFQKEHELNIREFFRKNLNELDYFENNKIKQKNGEILLSNEKITKLETIVANLIESIRYYSVYITVLQFQYNKIRNKCKSEVETKNSEFKVETVNYELQTTEETIDQQLQIYKLNLSHNEDERVEKQETQLPIQFVRPVRSQGFF